MRWVIQQLLLGVLPVERAIPADGHASEEHIVALVHDHVVEWSPGEFGEEAEVEDREHIKHVLVEHVQDKVAVSSVSFPTVGEHQIL